MGKHWTWKRIPGQPALQHPSILDIVWAAGLYEGEGTCLRKNGSDSIELAQKDREILDKLSNLFGGNVGFFARKRGAIFDCWFRWELTGVRARGFLMTIYQFLSTRRKVQALRVLRPSLVMVHSNNLPKTNSAMVNLSNCLPAVFQYRDRQSREWWDVLELPRNFHFMSVVAAKDVGFEHPERCFRCREFGEFVERRYRELAQRVHPDRGGTEADMQRLNAAVRIMRRYVRLPFFPEIDWMRECA